MLARVKRVVGVIASVPVLVSALLTGVPQAEAAGLEAGFDVGSAGGRGLIWGPCAAPGSSAGALGSVLSGIGLSRPAEPSQPAVECATVRVPLDYAEPEGQQIKLAVNRIRGSVSRDANHLGVLLVNPGGPGASGLRLAEYVASALPADVAARYDVIGFDPRGVGASTPSMTCVDAERYYAPPRLDSVPRSPADETALLARAQQYAQACGDHWGWFLPYLTTENAVRDMDAIRQALGEDKISYLGYSYGTYLGSVYATMFPAHVRRLVLDSVVDPGDVWYDANINQDYAFDRRHRDFLAWVAKNDAIYRLGTSSQDVSFAWYAMRDRLGRRPAGDVVGPSELDDTYTVGGYTDNVWPTLAAAFSAYVRNGDTAPLVQAYRDIADNGPGAENGYAVYLGIQCHDAPWPRDWDRWRRDTTRVAAHAPFMAWPNAVYNAPCAFWPEHALTPPHVGSADLPPVLLIQSRHDAATPYPGALDVRGLFPTARLVTEPGGNHGVSLGGNACVDRYLADYLRDALAAPRRLAARGPDAVCPGLPEPRPAARMAYGSGDRHLALTRALLGR
ncbi:alpha/beta fold hydrolase [Streptosporangiaceae bacterium NEAU-GS5]|nr:alpha/beta fold hydrolase [Streptosporangiaceae bacterium NEAU-GS5]